MIGNYKEIKFSYSYNFAGFIREKIFKNDAEDYILDYFHIDDYGFQQQLLKTHRRTILHDYLQDELRNEFEYLGRKADPDLISKDWELLLDDYQVNYSKSEIDEEEDTYLSYLERLIIEHVIDKIANETFQLLFGDRMFCLRFNSIIAEIIQDLKLKDYHNLLEKNGIIKRYTYFPEWVQRAVFLRDKGCCAVCLDDLSGLLKTDFNDAIDHIVPLNLGGSNDITNFQLICRKCNLEKLGHTIKTSEYYPVFFTLDDK
jgi:hypothetical protein